MLRSIFYYYYIITILFFDIRAFDQSGLNSSQYRQ